MAPPVNRKSKRIIVRNKRHDDHGYTLLKKVKSYDHLNFDSNYMINNPSKTPHRRPRGRPRLPSYTTDGKQKLNSSQSSESKHKNHSNGSKSDETSIAIRRARNKEAVRRSRERSRLRHVLDCQEKIKCLRSINSSLARNLAELRRTVRVLTTVHAIISNQWERDTQNQSSFHSFSSLISSSS